MKKFVISLDRTPDRLEVFVNNNSAENFIKFSAIDGHILNRDDLIKSGIIDENLKYNNSALGCALSHITLWQHCAAIEEPITILEDDCILHHNFSQITKNIISKNPEFDSIQWGWNFEGVIEFKNSEQLGNLKAFYDHNHLLNNLEKFRNHNHLVELKKVLFFYGSPCYTISPQGARKMLNLLLPLRNSYPYLQHTFQFNPGIDCTLNYIHPIIESFVAIQPIAFTLNDKSNTTIPFDPT